MSAALAHSPQAKTAVRHVLALNGAVFIVAALLSLYFVGMRAELTNVFQPASLASLVAHDAPTPFQYRLLVPTLVEWIHGRELQAVSGIRAEETVAWIDFACVLGTWAAMRALIAGLGIGSVRSGALALLIFYALPFHYLFARQAPLRFVWDMPAILFFSCGLLALQRRWWSAYYIVFALGTLNKETTLFLAGVQLLTTWGAIPRRIVAQHLAAQLAIWIAIKFALHYAFSANPGVGSIPNVLEPNLRALLTPAALFSLASVFGFLWIPVAAFHKQIADPFARRALWVCLPYALGAFYVGSIVELRVWGELIPLIALGVVEVFRGSGADSASPRALP